MLVGKLRGNVDGDIWLKEGVEARKIVSGNVDGMYRIKRQLGFLLILVHREGICL